MKAAYTRRRFLAGAAAVGGAALLRRPLPPARAQAPSAPRVAIVGAGLAGLTCAHRLATAGIPATVYEANPERLGGRCWSARDFAYGQVAEHGGEFIDTSQHHIRRLASELGLRLEDARRPVRPQRGLSARYVFEGRRRAPSDVWRGWELLVARAARDARRIGPYLRSVSGRAAREIDEMTAREWIDAAAPGDAHRLLRLASSQYMAEEYGLDVGRLSALNMVFELGPSGPGSDERFTVHGGNDLIVSGLAERLPADAIRRDAPLSVLRRAHGGYALEAGGECVRADVVVLCLPFTALRRVDLEGSGLSAHKRRCIRELGMGTNSKLLVQFRRHFRHYGRWSGEFYDERIDTWDSSLGEGGRGGLLTVYAGGRAGTDYPGRRAHGEAPHAAVARDVRKIERAVPGLGRGFNGRAWLDVWARDPYTHGSYAAFTPGQFSRFWGNVGRAEGNVHFGGEHTQTVGQGYLEGAVASGERCAREVAAKLA